MKEISGSWMITAVKHEKTVCTIVKTSQNCFIHRNYDKTHILAISENNELFRTDHVTFI